MEKCEHKKLDYWTNLVRIDGGPIMVNLMIRCGVCGRPFKFGDDVAVTQERLMLMAEVKPAERANG